MHRWLLLVLCGALLCAGCRVDATTTIRLDRNGGGAVAVRIVLDPQAVQLVERGGGTLENRIVLSDVHRAGWTVTRWTHASNGAASITISHPFRNGDELAQVLTELTGKNGIVRDVHVTHTRNMLQDRDG